MQEFKVDMEKVDQEVENIKEERNHRPNILIMGQARIGKTSICNYIFKKQVGETSAHKPCSIGIEFYSDKDSCVNIYDSEGYEVGSEKQSHYEELIFDKFLSKPEMRNASNERAVHLVWYAVSAGSRFTDLDVKIIKRLKEENYKVALLLTKIDGIGEKALNQYLECIKERLPWEPVFKLSIHAKGNKKLEDFCDWDKLIEWSLNNLSDVLKDQFLAELKVSNKRILELKHSTANKYIIAATTAAAGVALSPIPFSDAALLVPIQIGGMLKILTLYGIKINGQAILIKLAAQVGAANLGRALAGNLIKLIPGFGSAVGAAVNAGVASSITGALLKALEQLCYKQAQAEINGEEPTIDIEKILTSSEFLSSVMNIFKQGKK